MATTFSLTGTLRLVPRWEDDVSPANLVDATTFLQTFSIAQGTATGRANAYWRDVRAVAAGDTDEIELDTLPLAVMGGTGNLNLATVRMVYLRNRGTVTLSPSIGGGQFDVPPGGSFFWHAPATVSAGPIGASLEVQNSAASAGSYEILLVGVKA